MIFRGEPDNPDWTFGKGKQNYLSGNDAIMKNIENRLKTFYSECFFDSERGMAWIDLLAQKDPDLLVLSIKREINDCYGVVRVTDVRYTLDSSRKLTVRYQIDTIYSSSVAGTVAV